MTRAKDRQLRIASNDEADRAAEVERSRSWSDVEGRIVKHALGSGVRRVTDLAIRVDEWQDARARLVWSAALRMIEAGKRTVWIGGGLESEIAKGEPIETARDCIAWIKAAGEEHDADEVSALLERVRDRNFSAKVCTQAVRLLETARSGHTEAAGRASALITELRDLDEARLAPGSTVELESAADAWDRYVKQGAKAKHGKLPVLGLAGLDRWVRLPPESCTVIGAEPSVGKSTLGAGAVLATAQRGIPAALVSVEDPHEALVAKMAAALAKVNPREPLSDQPALDLPDRIATAGRMLRGLPLWGTKIRDRSADGVLAAMRSAHARGCRLVVVDYLTAIRRPSWLRGVRMDKREWTDEIIAALLALAGERGLSLIVCSQFNRSKERHEPTLHDLKETSTIGEAAHNAVLLYRARGDAGKTGAIAKLAKVKDGPGYGHKIQLQRDAFGCLVESTNAFKDDDDGGSEWGAPHPAETAQ